MGIKKQVLLSLCLLIVLFSLESCRRKYIPVDFLGTKMISHHAYLAPGDSVESKNYYINAFDKNNGIEVDVQLSQDRTLWLYHNNVMSSCGSIKEECIMSKNDKEIANLAQCENPKYCFTKLETVLEYMESHADGKVISLDVKTWFDSKCTVLANNVFFYYHNVAMEIIRLVRKHHLENRVMVESDVVYFLGKIKRNSDIACYLTTLGDYNEGVRKALKYRYTGISFQYLDKEMIDKDDLIALRNKGLRIQLWVVNGDSLLNVAKSIQPDFIQTDEY